MYFIITRFSNMFKSALPQISRKSQMFTPD